MSDKIVDTLAEKLVRENSLNRRSQYVGHGLRALFLVLAVFAFFKINAKSEEDTKALLGTEYARFTGTGANDASILIVPIRGEISGGPLNVNTSVGLGSLLGSSENLVLSVRKTLKEASKKTDLAEIVLFIESPGGGLTPSDEIYSMIRDWKEIHPRTRVSAYLYSMAASGGYYIAMAADTLVASPTTMVGSIGVIMQIPNLSDVAEKFGFKMNTIKSGENKDIGNMFRPMTDGDRDLLSGLVQQSQRRFVDVVSAGRPHMERAKIESLADGRVFSARDAVSLGLIDKTMGTFDAFIAERAHAIIVDGDIRNLVVSLPNPNKSLLDLLLGR